MKDVGVCMKTLIYISKKSKMKNKVDDLLHKFQQHFDDIQIEVDDVNLFLLSNSPFHNVIGYVSTRNEIELLSNIKQALTIHFITEDSQLINLIKQKNNSAKIAQSTEQILQELEKKAQASYVPYIKKSMEEHQIQDEIVPPFYTNPYPEPNFNMEVPPSEIPFIDLSGEVLAGDHVEEATNNEEVQNNVHIEVEYQEDPLYTRTRQIQKNLFAQQQWADHKIIGIWSPTGKTGVSTLAINFALYLAKQRVYTTVLEGLSSQPQLKQTLSRYTKVPKDWVSYASTIQEGQEPRNASWIYENVIFLPCTKSDLQYTWNPVLIEAYMTTTKIVDVTLVDFPSGHLQEHSKDALHFVDELWILFDDNYHSLINWKDYIKELEQKQIKVHLIMGRTYSFSAANKISKEMDLPLITTIPAMDEIAMHNQYQNIPLYFVDEAAAKLESAYSEIATHLFKQSYKPSNAELPTEKSQSFFKKLYTSILKA